MAAAVEAQAGLVEAAWPGPRLRVRMGLHLGEAEERDGDYFGPTVNTTARVEAAGHGDQVLLTEAVRSAAGVAAMDLGVHHLRDVPEPVGLFQLGDSEFAPLRVIDPQLSNLPVRPTRTVRTQRSANALAFGARGGVVIGSVPIDRNTSPKLGLNCPAPSWITSRIGLA